MPDGWQPPNVRSQEWDDSLIQRETTPLTLDLRLEGSRLFNLTYLPLLWFERGRKQNGVTCVTVGQK